MNCVCNVQLDTQLWSNTMMKAALLILTVSISTGVIANSEFTQLDTNNDGAISLSESKANPSVMAQFKDLDTDNNGRLSKSEYSHFVKK